jgi:hypothetical protein
VQRHDRSISEHADEKESISNFPLFCRDFLARKIDSFYVSIGQLSARKLFNPESILSSGYRDQYRNARRK